MIFLLGMIRRGGATAAIALALSGCAIAPAPITESRHVAMAPANGDLAVSVQPAQSIGDVLPVYISVANGTDIPRQIVPSQIFAIDADGDRVAPIPPGEAARQAGNATALKAMLESGVASGVAGGAVGSGIGAIAGSLLGGVTTGAVVGGAVGAGRGIFSGVRRGQNKAERQAREQIKALALKSGEVRKDFTVGGYVFFPAGSYTEVKLLVVNKETGTTETFTELW